MEYIFPYMNIVIVTVSGTVMKAVIGRNVTIQIVRIRHQV